MTKKKEKTETKVKEKAATKENTKSNKPSAKKPAKNPYEHSTIYKKNEKTGEWEVKNPSGSIAYNYLYRDDLEEEE